MVAVMGRSHSVSGLAAGLGVGLFSGSAAVTALCGALGYVTSWLPDFDHPNAKSVKALGPVGWLLCRIIRAASAAVGLPKHRGLSHTALFAVAVGVAMGLASGHWTVALDPWLIGGAASAGVAAALAGDLITKASLPHLFWPLSRISGPPKWLRITTGKRVEKFVVYPLIVASCGWLAYVALIP